MKLAVLIGASSKTKESPLVPLMTGTFRLIVTGLKDSSFDVVFEDGISCQLGDVLTGDRNFKLVRTKEGTEGHSICVYAERVDGNELTESA